MYIVKRFEKYKESGEGRVEDEELLRLLQEEFETGYIQLVNTYIGFVYVIARSKLASVCSEETIEEFVSDVFYTFSKQIGDIDLQKGTIKAYLSIIAKRKAIRKYYEQIRNQSLYSIDEEDTTIEMISKENVEESILERERRAKLIEEINGLGRPDSEIMIRKYYYGQTAEEIGRELNMKSKTVAKRAERTLNKLRKRFKESEFREALI